MAEQLTPEQIAALKEQLRQLNEQYEKLAGKKFFEDMPDDIRLINNLVGILNKEIYDLEHKFDSISKTLQNVLTDFNGAGKIISSINGSFSKLVSLTSKVQDHANGINVLSVKELKSIQNRANAEVKNLKFQQEQGEKELTSNKLTEKQREKLQDQVDEINKALAEKTSYLNQINGLLEEEIKNEIDVQKKLGLTGATIKGITSSLEKMGISSIFFADLNDDLRAAAKSGGSLKVAMTGAVGLAKGLGQALTDPLTLFTFFVKQGFLANSQVVELGKSLGTAGEKFRETLTNIELASSNINVTTTNLVKAFNELVTTTGFAYEFTADQLETQIKLTEQVGLQADEAAQIQRLGVLNNKTSEETYRSFVRGLAAARNQLRVGIDFKATLAAASKISGQLAANLGYNPERIAQAVVQAKAFGMTLEQTAKSGEQLLNWESSIENELKAELLTGKQINLERARAAALVGDQVTLAEELNKQVGTSAEFTRMNVIQQRSLAEAVGMTADELAETLRRREEAIASGKSLAQVTEEEAAAAIERQKAQDKFNKGIEKLTSIIGNLLAGPLGQLLDVLSGVFTLLSKIISGVQEILGSGITKTLMGAIGGFAVGGPAGALIGAVGGAISSADDMVGYGARTLLTPTGAIALNNDDTVIAGTNLSKGDDTISLPKGSISLGNSVDLTPMINAINEVKTSVAELAKRPVNLYMDGKQVGSNLVQGSYKLA